MGGKRAAGTTSAGADLDRPAAAAGNAHRRTDVLLRRTSATGPRAHWMRLPRDVGGDPRLHSVLLAYASDYLLLDMAFRSHPEPVTVASFAGFSLDHALWLHRPVRFDRWHATPRSWWPSRATADWCAARSRHRRAPGGQHHSGGTRPCQPLSPLRTAFSNRHGPRASTGCSNSASSSTICWPRPSLGRGVRGRAVPRHAAGEELCRYRGADPLWTSTSVWPRPVRCRSS